MDDQNKDGSLGYTVLHNGSCQHAAPTFINLMNAAILRFATLNKNMTIQTRNHPLPMTKSQHLQRHVCFSTLPLTCILWYHLTKSLSIRWWLSNMISSSFTMSIYHSITCNTRVLLKRKVELESSFFLVNYVSDNLVLLEKRGETKTS